MIVTVPLRRLVDVIDCAHVTAPFVDDDRRFPVASIRECQGPHVDLSDCKYTTQEFYGHLRAADRAPRAGDLLFIRNVSVGLVSVVSSGTPDFAVGQETVLLRRNSGVDPIFLRYALVGAEASQAVASVMVGSTFRRINVSAIRALPIVLPPPDEQRVIAGYLDHETARIDTLIEEQQRLIEMLRERRRALRVHIVLHGITPTDEVASPLPWARKISRSWTVVPLTSVAQLESGHTPTRSREDWWTDCHISWVSLHDVGTMRGIKYLHETAQRISDAGIANSSARLLPARTVVLSRDATVGRSAIMGVPMATSQHFAAWICGPLLDPEYLWALFADAMQPFFDSFQNGSTIRTVGMGDLKAFRIPLPPLDEQRRIVRYLDDETPKIDTLIAETERFIELARERRAALITAAVTGQIDVREMA
jgi:type I restriction enzyme S subunit